MYYRNDTSITPLPPLLLSIPGCAADCPWSQFLHLTHDSIPQDYVKECRLPRGVVPIGKIFDTHPSTSQVISFSRWTHNKLKHGETVADGWAVTVLKKKARFLDSGPKGPMSCRTQGGILRRPSVPPPLAIEASILQSQA